MRALWPFGLVAFLYFATWPFHHGLNNPNEMVRVYMTKALVDHGTPAIDAVVREWGPVDDKAIHQGHLYAAKAPLQSLVGVPVYEWLISRGTLADKRRVTTRLRWWSSTLPGLALAFALAAWARARAPALGATRRIGTALGLALALGTMLYPYALTFTGHILAAATAGGAYLGAMALSRCPPDTRRARTLALLTGALAGAAPFAEYPAALVALPSLLGALWVTPPRSRLALAARLAAGAAAPLALGLYVHWMCWGSPFATAYSFLQNRGYARVHGSGFFGVGLPKGEALWGALFSPETGLFFYSPVLLVGLVAASMSALGLRVPAAPDGTSSSDEPGRPLDRRLAVVALVACGLEFLFIAGHRGWRGGWTVGPRYIIGVVPVLGVWTIEAVARPALRRMAAPLAAASILITGPAAALYPHLPDAYTNPVGAFLWPSYRAGLGTYGIAHSLGLTGHAANLVHLLPLIVAALYVALADVVLRDARGARPPRSTLVEPVASAAAVGLLLFGIALIPERDPPAAARETTRLWGFWEPR